MNRPEDEPGAEPRGPMGPSSGQDLGAGQARSDAAELDLDAELLSDLEHLIARRIGTAVRHLRSEGPLGPSSAPGQHPNVPRHAFGKHWFELLSPSAAGARVPIFVKSGPQLRIHPE